MEERSSSAEGSPARTSRGCSAAAARRSSTPTTSCSTRRSCPRRRPGRSSRATSSSRCGRCAPTPSCSSAASVSATPRLARSSPRRSAARSRSATSARRVALGAVPRTFPVPGLAEHGRGFKDVADAIDLRNRVLRALESAAARIDRGEAERDLGFVFVGAGLRGGRGARGAPRPGARGRSALVPDASRIRQRWVLVDAAPTILPEIPRKLGEYTHQSSRAAGSRSASGRPSRRSTDRRQSSPTGRASRRGRSSGPRASEQSPDLARLALPLDDRGRVVGRLDAARRRQPDDVWALGDGAAVPNAATPGRFDPPTCQHALRQARRLAKNLQGPEAIRLSDARPGRDARPIQGHRRAARHSASAASSAGSSRARTTCTRCR